MLNFNTILNTKDNIKCRTFIDLYEPTVIKRQMPKVMLDYYKQLKYAFEHKCASPNRKEIFEDLMIWAEECKLNSMQNNIYNTMTEKSDSKYKTFINSLENTRETYINISKDHIKLFIEYITNPTNIKNNKMFLIGDYGEGKTFLINYIFSVYQGLFDDLKTINIKIDLTQTGIKADLLKTTRKKACNIIKEKYLIKESWEIKFYEFKKGLKKDGRKILSTFIKKDKKLSDIFLDENLEEIYSILKEFIIKEKHKILYFIDGFDNYNIDYVSENEFRRATNKLVDFMDKNDDFEMYIYIMRHESNKYLMRRCHHGNISTEKFKLFKLFTIDTLRIVESKLELFKKEIEIDEKQYKIETVNTGEEFINILKLFIIESYRIENGEILTLDSLLLNFFNTNNRNAVLGIESIANDLLLKFEHFYKIEDWTEAKDIIKNLNNSTKINDFINQYWYIVLNALMLNKNAYCLQAFRYDSKGKFCGTIREGDYDERSLIPNLFSYNHNKSYSNKKNTFSNILIKIRILQYLNSKQDASHDDIKIKLNHLFGYDENIIHCECLKLYAEECTRKKISDFYYEDEFKYHVITLKGKFLIENIIFKFSYLFHSIEEASIYEDIFSYLGEFKVVEECFNKEHSKLLQNLGDTLSNKIKQINIFLDYIKEIEDIELKRYNDKYKDLYFSFNQNLKEDNLLITNTIQKTVKQTIRHIQTSYFGKNYM